MSTTLPHGIIQINEGNISWYGDITANWQLIDSKIGIYDAAVASIPAPANTGTLTINYAGTIIAMFGADDAGNVTADIPAPGDGTLTIQLNGVDVQTFTANASTNATANIQCVDLSSAQTIAGNKEFTGTTTAHDLVPSATDTYNLGSASYQWNNAYIKSLTINGVACGDILTHNASEFANNADVVHIKGSDDIIDSKTFISLYTQSSGPSLWMKNTSFTMGTAPTTNRYSGIWVQDNNGTDTAYIVHQANKNNSQNLKFSVSNTDGTTVYQNALTFQGRLDGTFNFYSDNPANLGTSTNKWESIYSNTYYLGDTAFGNIVTHNASEFVQVSDLATVATSGSYNDLSNKPTIPTVNDGTLTIMVDGITVGTFSANQSTNTTIALTSSGGGATIQPMSKSIAHSIAASVFGA